ncbi:MAG: MinD/ParA family protein [Thermodesulfovibrio sp.]|nr:MinD/ParA family protein [Thermodesulfovibrio sp.]MDW7999243.1 MinD/ParA family protein [Thermodesulfovibrio sp.]
MKTNIPRIIAVSSGKGGVGKTNFVTNIALIMKSLQRRVLLMDADVGLSNIDIMFGIAPKYNIKHLLSGEKSIKDIIARTSEGIDIIPASSGIRELTQLTYYNKMKIIEELETIDNDYDIFLIDTGAGISDNVTFFCSAAHDNIVIVTPEPTSIADAYALIKVLYKEYGENNFRIVVNNIKNPKEAKETFRKISMVAERFLGINLDWLGVLPYDEKVKDAVIAQKPYVSLYPTSDFSKKLAEIARQLLKREVDLFKGGMQFFLKKALAKE